MPLVFLLLFVYVFGGTLGAGLGSAAGGPAGGRAAYADYVAPGDHPDDRRRRRPRGPRSRWRMDMTEGIIARFRTMAIVARSSVLTGHVLGASIQTLVGSPLSWSAPWLVGFRPARRPRSSGSPRSACCCC